MTKKFRNFIFLIIALIASCLVLIYFSWGKGWLMMLFRSPEKIVFEDLLLKEDELQEEIMVLEGFLLKSENLTIFTEKINMEDGKIKSTGAAVWVEDREGLIEKAQKNLKKEEIAEKRVYYGRVRLAGQFFCQEKWECGKKIEERKGYGYLDAYGCQIIPFYIKVLK